MHLLFKEILQQIATYTYTRNKMVILPPDGVEKTVAVDAERLQSFPPETACIKGRELQIEEPAKLVNQNVVLSTSLDNVYLDGWKLGIVVTSLTLGIFLIALDTTIIGVAVPKISSEFENLNNIAWFGSAYLLTVTAFQPSFGSLYKFFNVKIIYISSIVLFEGLRLNLYLDYKVHLLIFTL